MIDLQIDPQEWLAAAKAALMAVAKRSPNPIVENLCLLASPQGFALVGTDLETTVVAQGHSGKSAKPHQIILPAVAGRIPLIRLSDDGANILAESSGAIYTFPKLDGADFPRLTPAPTGWTKMPDLASRLGRAAPAMSENLKERECCGVLLTEDSAVATDSWRIHVAWGQDASTHSGIFLPAGLVKIAAQLDGDMQIAIAKSVVHVESPSQLVRCYAATPGAEKFPPWEKLIPTDRSAISTHAPSAKVLDALSALELVADPVAGVFLIIDPTGLRIQLVDDEGKPGASTTVKASAVESNGYAIVEIKHLRQAVEQIKTENVVISLYSDMGESGVVEVSDEAGTEFTAVISAR